MGPLGVVRPVLSALGHCPLLYSVWQLWVSVAFGTGGLGFRVLSGCLLISRPQELPAGLVE